MNYNIKLLFRNLIKNKNTAALNILGLTTAFAAFIVIIMYVYNEYNFNSYNAKFNNIYRLEIEPGNSSKTSVYMLGPTGQTLAQTFHEVVNSTIYMPWGKWGEQPFYYNTPRGEQSTYSDFAYCDQNLVQIFSFNFIYSNDTNPLQNNGSVIVSRWFAQKTWGNINPVGQYMRFAEQVYTVSGVFENLPDNSVFRCPVIMRLATDSWLDKNSREWMFTNYPTFIELKPGVDVVSLQNKINQNPVIKSKYCFNGNTPAQILLRPLSQLRFTPHVAENPLFETNNKAVVDSLFWVAVIVIIMALINYVNFATAMAPKRAKAFGISQVIGSSRLQNIFALIFETTLLFFVSFIAAILVAYFINELFITYIFGYRLPFAQYPKLIAATGAMSVIIGLLAGIYPALATTKHKPVDMLKNNKTQSRTNLRGVLAVIQFAATIALIIASVTVLRQIYFMKNSDPGFDKSSTLVIGFNNNLRQNYNAFEQQLKQSNYVAQVARSRAVPGQAQEGVSVNVNGQECFFWNWGVDANYVNMMGFEIVDGRNFIDDNQSDIGNFICNQTAAKRYNWAIGTIIDNHELIGIIKDFNIVSMRETVDPFMFYKTNNNNLFQTISIKLTGNNIPQALEFIEKTYNQISPQVPFRAFFLDSKLNLLYVKESQQAWLITLFCVLSILVSVLGIFGLSVFLCQNKTKEIGIRKVNGAKITEILTLLNKSFVQWIIIAFIISSPLAYNIMQSWLSMFAFKTNLSWWVFAIAAISALCIALFTVSWQTIKAATRNPVDALRYE